MKHLSLGSMFFLLFSIFHSNAQAQQNNKYPQNYFSNPLTIPLQLVANFGELRANHFHMGLDIRTQGRENLPVYAPAHGYIARIKIEKYGYGNAIYINHPNGYTTVYAHLNSFYPALAAYLKQKQYQEQSWEQDFILPANLFPVNKGQFIAYSGNTGGSAGPHLHFEIRDTKTEKNLNPLLFGFGLRDNTPPVLYKLFWYDRRVTTYSNPGTGKQIPLMQKGNTYSNSATPVIVNSPILSLGFDVEDIIPGNPFKVGIYTAQIWLDDSLINGFTLNDFSYLQTRYLNACIDYSKYSREKKFVQYLAQLPGNHLDIFDTSAGNGTIILADTAPHSVKIAIADVAGNTTRLNFTIQLGNITLVQNTGNSTNMLLPNKENKVTGKNAKLVFTKNSFYDFVPFNLQEITSNKKNAVSPAIILHNLAVPVHDSFDIYIKTTLPANNYLKNNVIMQLVSGSNVHTYKGDWNGDWMHARFRNLGTAQLLIDTIPPSVTPIGWKSGMVLTNPKKIAFSCTDDIDEIETFNAWLDGKWLLFTAHENIYTYMFDEYCTSGSHTLTIQVTDIAGNSTQKNYTFNR
ncbi:peptidoglycan DD-metalloendopeptidase family protein [Limnovirga soli]|uniref:Peptidoglycan DD-metalloendopeptidase family protein n=1 Tax=Limnovirga soli TaxID=2656915 RepID=A0A8J8FFH2_9BACT|nr:peptidoglycan DD-metalloendopeptidase family protein [Limnovirga soli]NNV56953.1 peptidoglycan DD-metalloendopeptidase family protein [Limnovirga soli]